MKFLPLLILLLPFTFVRWTVVSPTMMPYPTVGWWGRKGHKLVIASVRLSRRRYELLILTHETIESLLCWAAAIPEEEVTRFDVEYEAVRPKGDLSEPGDATDCPYRGAHRFATLCERGLARLLFVDWDASRNEVESL